RSYHTRSTRPTTTLATAAPFRIASRMVGSPAMRAPLVDGSSDAPRDALLDALGSALAARPRIVLSAAGKSPSAVLVPLLHVDGHDIWGATQRITRNLHLVLDALG